MRSFSKVAMTAIAFAVVPSMAFAADTKLPNPLAWTAYDVGSGGYNQSVAIGKALKDAMGIDLRVLPGKNDVSRQVPLRAGKVHFSATGIGATFFAQEGVFEFGAKSWGPQQVMMLLAANADSNLSLAVAADTGVKKMSDLRGKRVAWVVGSPALNQNVTAMLAFGGLTWADVKKVEVPGFGASFDGIINGTLDAAFSQTTSGKAYQLQASPRGIVWPPLPHGDKEGWARVRMHGPHFIPNKATLGAGISKEKPHEGGSYPYPVLITYASQDEKMVYAMTKAMIQLFPKYKGTVPGIDGWAIERQNFDWVVPFHPGAIRYLKEVGKWSAAAQKHNDRLLARQKVLKEAWAEVNKKGIADPKAHYKAWLEVRAARLKAAGFDVIFQ
ncbi:MAG: TAXI family TRAP transporter solute-binding subunit [Hyphomicrobiaceae bacterium]|nr:TAXI family TRAP transporter solute-binding subunit [Hyphomicrobiaceae bacterium]